jgi:hypothetical protein
MASLTYHIKAHVRISHNLREGRRLKALRAFWATVYLFKALRIGLLGMRRQQGGSTVIYKGERWAISNWPGHTWVNLARKGEYAEAVPQHHIRDVRTIAEYAHRFKFMADWYLSSWYEIDVQRRLYHGG